MPDPLRDHLVRLLTWEEAHVGFDAAIAGLPAKLRGARPPAFAHSPWQIVEHLRLAQRDLLDFATNPRYSHDLTWPDDYWPRDPKPPTTRAWTAAVDGFRADREELVRLVRRRRIDLFALVPTGTGRQTVLRAILLVADHNAYHVGQLVAIRRALGCWP